jgi:predicted metalloendopeptidase
MLDLTALDRSNDPCSDFYAFSCGGWLKRTPLPADQSSWTRSFSSIHQANQIELRGILESYSRHDFSLPSQYSELLGNYYSACMNLDELERTKNQSLQSELSTVKQMTAPQLSEVIAELQLKGYTVLFDVGSSPDFKKSTQMIAEVDQGGFSLPNRNYYFDEDKAPLRAQYLAHLTRMFELSGIDSTQAQEDARSVLSFETELAKNALSPVERREPKKIYHLLPREHLAELAPCIHWDSVFATLGAPPFTTLNIAVPEFFKGLHTLLETASLNQTKTYLQWRILHALAPDLGQEFRQEHFNFYGKALYGQKEMKPRWKYCVQSTDRAMGDALGEGFVKKTFGETGKTQTLSILKSIQSAFAATLTSTPWMDTSTRNSALHKLEAVQNKIGYPEKWTDFSPLKIDPTSHLHNQVEISRFLTFKSMKKIGRVVDRAEWEMSPPTVNAYYNPQMNEIVFPAGILQSPFYSQTSSLAANYGAIGMVIGHELTHGFDDQGRQFDAEGNLKDWWTADVARIFDHKTQCMVEQFASYTVADGVHLNGELTLGENIADLGGLKLAYSAYRSAISADEEGSGSAFTGDQQFFISFAQAWCTQSTDEHEKLGAASDPHSAPKYRVNGVVSNLPEFEKAFRCSPGAPLAPTQRCSIW